MHTGFTIREEKHGKLAIHPGRYATEMVLLTEESRTPFTAHNRDNKYF